MSREDRWTNTPEDAAEYERTVFGDNDRGYRDDRPSPSELAEDERETCAGCDRPVYRDEARRLPGGLYACDDCAPHIKEPRP